MHETEENQRSVLARVGMPLLVVVLLATSAYSLVSVFRERKHARELAAGNQEMTATLSQVRGQLEAVSARLDALSAVPSAPESAREPAPPRRAAAAAKSRPRPTQPARRREAEDPRWKHIETQLSDQQKQIASTRDEVEKTRSDLQDKLSSTRDELGTSIARTHEELVALQKRGERNYYEFTLAKSKQFQRVGPISLSLRKANVKHKSYNLAMIVDDYQLGKKNVNLFEPVLINLTDRPQPVELVVNDVSKDLVKGYVSEPKYKKSELAGNAAASGGTTQTAQLPR